MAQLLLLFFWWGRYQQLGFDGLNEGSRALLADANTGLRASKAYGLPLAIHTESAHRLLRPPLLAVGAVDLVDQYGGTARG